MILIFNTLFVCINTAICSLLICFFAVFKLLPVPPLKRKITCLCNGIIWLWCTLNHKILELTSGVEWDIQGGETLHKKGWYLLVANHISWADIVIILCVFRNRIPMAKFFLKQQLLYVPFMGLACWAVDMPFMRRYSRRYLLKNPDKRGKDLATTRRACAKFRHTPTTVVNFVEGTRITAQKQEQLRSPFDHLLPPKPGGIAYTLGAMGEQFDNIIDVTIAYPDNRELPFKDLMAGKMKKVVVRIDTLPVDGQVSGDYFGDKVYKRSFQQWLQGRWREKDRILAGIYDLHTGAGKCQGATPDKRPENTPDKEAVGQP